MRPPYVGDRASARSRYRAIPITLLAVAVAAALSACGDSTTSPGAAAAAAASHPLADEAREASSFEVAGITYPTVTILNGSTTLAVGGHETLTAKCATPTATWMGAYITWTTSNANVVSVSTSDWGWASGDQAYLTGKSTGTATIYGTTQSGTYSQITITVGGTAAAVDPSGYHEPAGMTAQINTGAMSVAPSQSYEGTWTEGSTKFTNFSPNTMSSVGEWAGNISAVPGGTGVRVTYGPSLDGGNSPVRFGAGFANYGSGNIYLRWKFRLSPNWTLSQASQLKVMEPRTINSTENHVISFSPYGQPSNGSAMYPNMFLQFNSGSGTYSMYVPGNSEGQDDLVSYFLTALANLGGSALGTWHTVEFSIVPESPAGSSNGQLTIWVDGTVAYQTSSVHYFLSGESMGWSYLMFDPTYGGDVATDHPPTSIYWDIDQLYVSTK
jgi:hypothetical protein